MVSTVDRESARDGVYYAANSHCEFQAMRSERRIAGTVVLALRGRERELTAVAARDDVDAAAGGVAAGTAVAGTAAGAVISRRVSVRGRLLSFAGAGWTLPLLKTNVADAVLIVML